MILDKSEEHTKENHKYLHGIHSLLHDTHVFCLGLISVEQCDMLLQGQKSILQSGAQRDFKNMCSQYYTTHWFSGSFAAHQP